MRRRILTSFFFILISILIIFTGCKKKSSGGDSADTAPPGEAVVFSAVQETNGDISLSWINPTDGDFQGIMIRRDTASAPAAETDGILVYDGPGTSYTDSGLTHGTTYYYAAFTYDAEPNYSSGVTANAVSADSTAPSPVQTLSAIAGDAQVDLSWTNPSDSDLQGIMIRRDTSSYPATEADGVLAYDGTGTSYLDDDSGGGLTNGITYYYTAFAYDEVPNYSTGENANGIPTAAGSLGEVSSFGAVEGDGKIDLTWINPGYPDFQGVIILRNTSSITDAPANSISYSVSGLIGTSTIVYLDNGTSYADIGLAEGTWYYKAFTFDSNPDYSTVGAAASATVTNSPPMITAFTPIFNAQGEGGTVLLRTQATDSNGTVTSVTVDLTLIGGSAVQTMYDDGTNGDVTAGDDLYSYLAVISPGIALGDKSLTVTATDDGSAINNDSINLGVIKILLDYPNTRIDTAPGAGSSINPQIVSSGDNVYVTWNDNRDGMWDIYFNYSMDAGTTWQVSDMVIDNAAAISYNPQIASSGDNVYITWRDNRSGSFDIYFNYSLDNGQTWLGADLRIDKDGAGAANSASPRIAASGNNVYIAWKDNRNGTFDDIYFNYSSDGGVSWQISDKRLDTNSAGVTDSENPQIASSGNNVYVVWQDNRSGKWNIYFNYSADGGLNWQVSDIVLDSGSFSDSVKPQIACSGNNVYVTWHDARSGNTDIYFNYSNNGGATWQDPDIRINTNSAGSFDSENPRMVCSGNDVFITWSDKRNGTWDVYFNYSNDGGASWQVSDIRIDAGTAASYDPQIDFSGGNIYVTWRDGRNGNYDVYFNYSTDEGATWQSNDIRLDTDLPGAALSEQVSMSCSGNNIFVTWRDDRNGDYDIYFEHGTNLDEVSSFYATPGDQQVDITWTNPTDPGFVGVLILQDTSLITDAPLNGTTYNVSDPIGSATVIYVNSGTSHTDLSLTNGTTYYYKAFVYDASPAYSTGVEASATPVDPSALEEIGSFAATPGNEGEIVLTWSNPADPNVTGLIILQNTSPISDTPVDGTPYNVTDMIGTSTVIYKGFDTTYTDANLTTGITHYYKAFTYDVSDNYSNGVTIDAVPEDITSPGDVDLFSALAGDGQILLTWTNPPDADFQGVMIRRATDSPPLTQFDGDLVYDGALEMFTDVPLVNDITYYYTAFAYDAEPNYSAGVNTGGTPRDTTPPGEVTVFTAVSGDTEVYLSWTNPGDADFAGVMIRMDIGSAPPTTSDGALVYEGSNESTAAIGLSNGTRYYFTAFTFDGEPNYSLGLTTNASATIPPVVTPQVSIFSEQFEGGDVLLSAEATDSDGMIVTVEADLTDIGGLADQAMYDDNTNGDLVAGDNIYSYLAAVAPGTLPDDYSLTVSVTDNDGATVLGSLSLSVKRMLFDHPNVRLDTDAAGAFNSEDPQVASSGNNVYVAWRDDRSGNLDIYFNYSTDKGGTWNGSDIRLDTDVPAAGNSTNLRIASSGNNVYVVWQDDRNGDADIYFNFSTDGGVSWNGSDIRIDTDATSADSVSPQIIPSSTDVYVVWQDSRGGLYDDIYFNYSTDGGVTWQPSDTRLDADVAGVGHSEYPQIAFSGSTIYVVWADDRNGSFTDIYLNYSQDGGVNWQAGDIRIDTDAAGTDSMFPQIACSSDNVYVTWYDYRNILADIYFNYSLEGGINWQSSDIRLNTNAAGAADSINPRIAYYGDNVYVVWQDYRDTNADIYFNYSTNGGAAWEGSDIRLDTDAAGAADSIDPRIASSGNNVYVAWSDYRNGMWDIFFNYSTVGDLTWNSADVRVDADKAGAADSEYPHITSMGSEIYVAWHDSRNGSYDVYFEHVSDQDLTAPSDAALFTAFSGDAQIDLTWINPGDPDFLGVIICRDTVSAPATKDDGTQIYIGTDASFLDTGLTNNTHYFYSIFTYDEVPLYSAGVSADTAPTDLTPPAQISSFAATSGDEQVDLEWTRPGDPDLQGVMIRRDTLSAPATPSDGVLVYDNTGTSHTDLGLTNGITYYYTAFTYDEIPNYSAGISVEETPLDVVAPSDVDFFTTVSGDQQVELFWQNPADADFAGVMIRRDTVSAPLTPGEGTLVYDGPGAAETYIDLGLTNDTLYYYIIFAYDEVPNHAGGVSIQATPTQSQDLQAPNQVGSLSPTPGDGLARLDWLDPPLDPPGDSVGYKVYYRTPPEDEVTNWILFNYTTDVFIEVTGLTNGVVYEFMVAGVDAAGNETSGGYEPDGSPGSPQTSDDNAAKITSIPTANSIMLVPNVGGGVFREAYLDVAGPEIIITVATANAGSLTSDVNTEFYYTLDGSEINTISFVVDATHGYYDFTHANVQEVTAGYLYYITVDFDPSAGGNQKVSENTLRPNGIDADHIVLKMLVKSATDASRVFRETYVIYPNNQYEFLKYSGMMNERHGATATYIETGDTAGDVIFIGGYDFGVMTSAERYRIAFEHFEDLLAPGGASLTMNRARMEHTATLLQDGKTIVVCGGFDPSMSIMSPSDSPPETKIYDQGDGWAPVNGDAGLTGLLVYNNLDGNGTWNVNEDIWLDNVAANQQYDAGELQIYGGGDAFTTVPTNPGSNNNIYFHNISGDNTYTPGIDDIWFDSITANTLFDVLPGNESLGLRTYEVFEADSGDDGFTGNGNLYLARRFHTATRLYDGTVLVTGGLNGENNIYGSVAAPLSQLDMNPTRTLTQALVGFNIIGDIVEILSAPGGIVMQRAVITNYTYNESNLWYNISLDGLVSDLLIGDDYRIINAGTDSIESFDANGNHQAPLNAKMAYPRYGHSATLLQDGTVFITGGIYDYENSPSDFEYISEIYNPITQTFATLSSMAYLSVTRFFHNGVLLRDGKVLITGGLAKGDHAYKSTGSSGAQILGTAELYDPYTMSVKTVGAMTKPRFLHSSVLLPSGNVLVVGGYISVMPNGTLIIDNSAEIFDPVTETFASTGLMLTQRGECSAALIKDLNSPIYGQAVVGGGASNMLAELYDESTGLFSATAHGVTGDRYIGSVSTLLKDGTVLITGGQTDAYFKNNDLVPGMFLDTAETYDSSKVKFERTEDSMAQERRHHTATLLQDGTVLITGGENDTGGIAGAEIYDPAARTFSSVADMLAPRYKHTATLLPTGKVFISGGADIEGSLKMCEIYDPGSQIFSSNLSLEIGRFDHTATLLPNGWVLITGGEGISDTSIEIYDSANNQLVTGTNTDLLAMNQGRDGHTAVQPAYAIGKARFTLGSTTVYGSDGTQFGLENTAWVASGAVQAGDIIISLNDNVLYFISSITNNNELELGDHPSFTYDDSGYAGMSTEDRLTGGNAPNQGFEDYVILSQDVFITGSEVLDTSTEVFVFDSLWPGSLPDPDTTDCSFTLGANPLNDGRYGHTMTSLADMRLLITGGRLMTNGEYTNLQGTPADFTDDTWTASNLDSFEWKFHTAFRMQNKMIIIISGHSAQVFFTE